MEYPLVTLSFLGDSVSRDIILGCKTETDSTSSIWHVKWALMTNCVLIRIQNYKSICS